VPAGDVVISEIPVPGTQMAGCLSFPADRNVSCNPSNGTHVVNVPVGNVSTQTVSITRRSKKRKSKPKSIFEETVSGRRRFGLSIGVGVSQRIKSRNTNEEAEELTGGTDVSNANSDQ